MTKLPWTLTGLLLLAATCPAAGGVLPGDTNRDGRVDRREWLAFLAARWIDRVDQDGDGTISPEEARRSAPLARVRGREDAPLVLDFDKVDANGDGRISKKELSAALAQEKNISVIFDDYDIDKDLHLNKWEFKEPPTNVGIRFRF
jgi:Ca2+-binding EF-hand superfamily protein